MPKYTVEEKIKACEDYLSRKKSAAEICIALGLSKKATGHFPEVD